MSVKMYVYVFFMFLVFQIIITAGVSYYLHCQKYAVFGRYLSGVFKANQSPDMGIVSENLTYFFWQNMSIFVASAMIYFAYPLAIGMFKGRAKKQSRTKHANMNYYAPVRIVMAVEDQGLQGIGSETDGRGYALDYCFEKFVNPGSELGGDGNGNR